MRGPSATGVLLFTCCCSTAQAFLPWAALPGRGVHTGLDGRREGRWDVLTATGGSGGSSGGLDFRPITGDDFAKNYRPVDRSGIPEKKEEILKTLPDVDIDNLVKEVPDVLFWSEEQLKAKLDVLAEAMPGQDLSKALSEFPDLLSTVDYLKEALKVLAEKFPGKTLPELLPNYMPGNLGNCPRPFSYPAELDWDVPYLDPGLMGNYSVEEGLIQAMKDSQHLVFGLWKEDVQALKTFVAATKRATLAFETRVEFLREYYGDEQFTSYYGSDLFGETMGHVGDWIKKHPGYENYMAQKLEGFQKYDVESVMELTPFEKEELMVKARAEDFFEREMEMEDEEDDDGWDAVEDEEEEKKAAEEAEGQQMEEEEDEFEQAMVQALWTFEVRAGFLELIYGTERFRTEISRRIRAETAGSAVEFAERYPDYIKHLEHELDGYDSKPKEFWKRVDTDMKEDVFVEAMMFRSKALMAMHRETAHLVEEELPAVLEERATESREEYINQLDEEELERLESLSDEEIQKHYKAYEAYLQKRFPQMFQLDGLGEIPDDIEIYEADEGSNADLDFAHDGF